MEAYSLENNHNFILPKTNLIGVGCIKDLPTQLIDWKLKKALIVTDKNLIKVGHVEMIETIFKNLFISFDIFDGVLHPDCTVSFVEDALSYFPSPINLLKRKYDFIVSIGGGTNHDCAKAVAVLAENEGSIIDFEGYNKITKPGLPVVAINTTAGSASEVSMYSIIVDESRKVKMTIGSQHMTPYISVNDPMFMVTMPKEVTATSGIDVITHSIEAYVSTEASPITDSLALGAIKIACNYLKRAYENGNDLEAREQMMFGNVKAGMAFNNAGLGYVHAISHQLGGFYKITHGICNAILLPHVLQFNAPAIPDDKMMNIAEAMGQTASNKTEALEKIISTFEDLRNDINIPRDLKAIGAHEEDFDILAINSLKDICTFTNPRQGAEEDIINILEKASSLELAEV